MSDQVASFYQKKNWKPTCITYSYAQAWYSNKDAFRKKYYRGETPKIVAAFEYGSIISNLIKNEPKHPLFKNLPRYSMVDEEYATTLGDVPFIFHPDMFEPSTFSFREIKTGSKACGWTQKKVHNHIQLDCYSLGIETLFGKVNEVCHLDWLVKEPVEIEIMPGIKAEGPAEFKGTIVSFERTITKVERYKAKEWLLQAYHEIVADFKSI
jgi:hypothetical protein